MISVQSMASYYYLALRNGNHLELKKLVGGSSTTLAATSFTVTAGTWYTLRVDVDGATLRGYVDGTLLLTERDGQFGAGNVGGATFFSSAEFDDFIVTSIGPGPTPTPTSTPTRTPTPTPTLTPTPTPQPVGDQPIGFASLNGGVTDGFRSSTTITRTTSSTAWLRRRRPTSWWRATISRTSSSPRQNASDIKTIVTQGAGVGKIGF
jgi:pectate lyase